MSVKVALVQLEVSDTQTRADREQRIIDVVREAAAAGATCVLLPELWPMGAFNTEYMSSPDAADLRSFEDFASGLARSAGVWLHAGSAVEVTEDGRRFNTAVIVDADGEVTARYRKQYLWGGDEGEAAVLAAGDEKLALDTPLGLTGITTCYELRFPELFRSLVDRGVQSYVVVAGWPQVRVEHWRTLLRARAIENQAWVLGVNCVGTHNGVQMGGYSAVISPRGEVLVEASSAREEVVYADIDLAQVAQWRDKFGWLADRKPCC